MSGFSILSVMALTLQLLDLAFKIFCYINEHKK